MATTVLSNFQVLGLIGNGSFAQVFKVRRIEDGQIYAMKKIRMAKMKEKDRNNALNEVRILASDGSDHVIEFKEAFYDQNSSQLCIVMEYAEQGDLLKKIHTYVKKNAKIEEEEIWKALVHITRGLRSLHQKKILHRDLKGANVFINSDGVYKLGDLNVSKVVKHDFARTQTGTPYYASPEVWKDMPYGTKSDMWSLGCVIYEMAAQRPPFTANDIQSLYKKIMAGYYPRIPSIYSNQLWEIISSLLKTKPQDRPSASQLLNNPLIQSHIDESNTSCHWAREELLSTITFPQNRNYKIINEILPKAQYSKKFKEDEVKELTIIGSFFKQNQWKPKVPVQKQQIASSSRNRVKSMHEQQGSRFKQLSSNVMKRQRIGSYAEQNKKEESSINNIPIFRNIPGSQKIPKKNPQSYINTPVLSKNVSRVQSSKMQEMGVYQSSRNKVQSVINKILTSETSRAKNKQNLRRIGEQIVSGTSRKDIAHIY